MSEEKYYTDEQKASAQKHLMWCRVFKLVAALFVAAGVIIFLVSLLNFSKGSIFTLIRNPFLIFASTLPFIPAYMFIYLSIVQRQKIKKIMANAKTIKRRSALFSEEGLTN